MPAGSAIASTFEAQGTADALASRNALQASTRVYNMTVEGNTCIVSLLGALVHNPTAPNRPQSGRKFRAKWGGEVELHSRSTKRSKGMQIPAINGATGNPAIRYVHPVTGQSVVVDRVTKEVIHVGGPGFLYGPGAGDVPLLPLCRRGHQFTMPAHIPAALLARAYLAQNGETAWHRDAALEVIAWAAASTSPNTQCRGLAPDDARSDDHDAVHLHVRAEAWRESRDDIVARASRKPANTSRHLSGTTKTASTMEWSRSSTSRLPTSDCGISRGPRGTPPSCADANTGSLVKHVETRYYTCITPPMKGRALHIRPHVHFEIPSASGGPAIENLHLPVIP